MYLYGAIAENGASKLVYKLVTTVFRPFAKKGLHFKNDLLWSILMRNFKKTTEIVHVVWEQQIK